MIAALRKLARALWPMPRLRWLLFGTLLFVAALPGIAALGLRVYENALIRRTEAELTAQSAAIAASAALLWPGPAATAPPEPQDDPADTLSESYEDTPTGVDLRSSPVLPERPAAAATPARADPVAQQVADRIAPAIAETKRATLASILLLDRQGLLLNGRDRGLSLAQVPEVRSALGGAPATVLRHNDAYLRDTPLDWISRATSIRMHQARPITVRGEVVGAVLVSRSPRALFRGMWEDRGKIALGVGAIFSLLLVLTAVLARAIVSPVERLSRASRALAQGRHAAPRRPTLEVREIGSLYDDFAAMSAAIARRSRYLRDFAAALSHEFKTPLAGLSGGIELLQDHGETMSAAERERFLANMAADAGRLSRLVSRLMELAQADMGRSDPSARADLDPLLTQVADGLRREGFAITMILPPDLPPLMAEAGALEAILTTLIENARQAGARHLTISAALVDGAVAIRLADDGPGIPAADRDRVFDPFFTSKRANGGTGLGLPIARALAENGRGLLELAESAAGAVFILTLPTA
ncbi:HAMP domain-containing sensor histidine kinase [Novosphingobium sp.]|uniref:sensor histidine kinase n=1 Tax=Novosphingobium sp. TaxID=1874826 RepID=UPI0022CCD028|nr:HAMP domain-containing sensor histidine kinase [Novosphingobium sp.]MCZ8019334.1 HAMP domain-containing sensor histidine kinase [Novosphingobium sp.]MCZ8035149.1 HAMP domain-containing sensor histidine kinase [Novosphingobium sp.]MCZ8050463.1 HAMP domain-containing sensor histidine kinase [Novosphingobium sp.]MCZ8058809.1 HAMP domain-containing sensor histidine kinase [Novosphingobium sp.]MCZ8232254.1 HAMP domain-containing sensor histidine kinase [Novosphingobium sp.]